MASLTTVVTFLMDTLGTVVTTITAEPVLLIGVGVTVVGGVIGIFKSAL